MTSRLRLLIALTVAALIVAVDWPVLSAQAISMDDDLFVGTNPLVTHSGWPSVGRFFSEVRRPSTVRGYYVPLTMTSLMLDHAAGGRPRDLRVFHPTNLALHVLTCMALLILLYRLFGSLLPAAIAALLFGLHPLTAEPVAWIAERKTMLATPLAIASIACYVEFCRGKRARWMAGCIGLYVLSPPRRCGSPSAPCSSRPAAIPTRSMRGARHRQLPGTSIWRRRARRAHWSWPRVPTRIRSPPPSVLAWRCIGGESRTFAVDDTIPRSKGR